MADQLTSGFRPGDRATWHYTPHGGARVQIEAPLERGGTKRVWVRPEHLSAPHARFCICHSGSACGPACANSHHAGCGHVGGGA